MERNPNRSEKRVSTIPTQAMMPRTNRTGLMPRLGEAGPEERTICMPGFDYEAVRQARQVIPGRRTSLERGNNRGSERLHDHRVGPTVSNRGELFPGLRNRQRLFPRDAESPSRAGITCETRATQRRAWHVHVPERDQGLGQWEQCDSD